MLLNVLKSLKEGVGQVCGFFRKSMPKQAFPIQSKLDRESFVRLCLGILDSFLFIQARSLPAAPSACDALAIACLTLNTGQPDPHLEDCWGSCAEYRLRLIT